MFKESVVVSVVDCIVLWRYFSTILAQREHCKALYTLSQVQLSAMPLCTWWPCRPDHGKGRSAISQRNKHRSNEATRPIGTCGSCSVPAQAFSSFTCSSHPTCSSEARRGRCMERRSLATSGFVGKPPALIGWRADIPNIASERSFRHQPTTSDLHAIYLSAFTPRAFDEKFQNMASSISA